MKKTSIAVLCLVVLLASLFAGCTQKDVPAETASGAAAQTSEQAAPSDETSASAPAEKIKIGVSAADLSNPYFIRLVDGIEDRADEIGNIEIIVADPKQDASKQAAAVENFISLNVDGIIMIAFQPESVESYLKDAMEKGIKVLAQSTLCENSDVYVSAKDADMGYALGVAAGQYIRDELGGEAQVAILNYPDIPQIIDRENGIRQGIAEYAPNAQIVASAKAGTPEEGMAATETLRQTYKGINVICAINDAGALGACNAVEASGNADSKFFIGGVDAIDQALEKIKEGGIYRATVDTNPYENGRMDLDLMLKLIGGETVEREIQVEVRAITAKDLA